MFSPHTLSQSGNRDHRTTLGDFNTRSGLQHSHLPSTKYGRIRKEQDTPSHITNTRSSPFLPILA